MRALPGELMTPAELDELDRLAKAATPSKEPPGGVPFGAYVTFHEAAREAVPRLVAEVRRLRKLFDDAGQGEHNVLALIDHYIECADKAEDRAETAEAERLALARCIEDACATGNADRIFEDGHALDIAARIVKEAAK